MFDVETSLSEAREKFKALIEYLLGEGQGHDAYRVEVKIFRDILVMALYLVAAWFMKKLGGNVGKAIVTETGDELPREALKSRRYVTIFGELDLWRWFYHRDGSPVHAALGQPGAREALLACLRGGWKNLVDLNLRPMPADDPFAEKPWIPAHDMVIIVSFNGADGTPAMVLVYPYLTLEPLAGVLG